MSDIVSAEHRRAADSLRQLLAAYRQSEDLISVGAYQPGSNPTLDTAIRLRDALNAFLRQGTGEHVSFAQSLQSLLQLEKQRSISPSPIASPGSPADPATTTPARKAEQR